MQPKYQLDLSFIIVNWNVRDLLRSCLNSIFDKTQGITFEVIVVDNASSDGSVEMVRREFPEVTVLASSKNLGFARANNLALPVAGGTYIGLLNPDTLLLNNAFGMMVAELDAEPEIGIVGPKLLASDGAIQRVCARQFATVTSELNRILADNAWHRLFGSSGSFLSPEGYDVSQPVDCISGACMVIRRDVLSGEQIFDPRFFMYSEDVDLCYEAAQHGWKVFYLSQACVMHYRGKSASQESISAALWSIRSSCQFFAKRYGRLTSLIFRWSLVAILTAKLAVTWLVRINPRFRQDPVWMKRGLMYPQMMRCALSMEDERSQGLADL